MRKSDPRTLSEIAGYQVAEKIGLPLQPWAAFIERDTEEGRIKSGILVERIHDAFQTGGPAAFVAEFPLEVAQLFAWKAFQRLEGDDPEFVLGKQTPLRFIDLDGYGPPFRLALESTDVAQFVQDSEMVFGRAASSAAEFGIEKLFELSLEQILARDPMLFFDFTGHPDHTVLLTVSTDAFRRRACKIRGM